MNDRPDVTGAHISFEIDSTSSRQSQGQAWIEIPNLPNVSETAPYGVGFQPMPTQEARMNTPEPDARNGLKDPSVAPWPSGASVVSPASAPEARQQGKSAARSPNRRTDRGRTNERNGRNPSHPAAIPPLKPSLPKPVPSDQRFNRFNNVDFGVSPLQGVKLPQDLSALTEVPDLLRQSEQSSALPKAKSGQHRSRVRPQIRPKKNAIQSLWLHTKQATEPMAQSVAQRIPSPAAIAHKAQDLGQLARHSLRKLWGVPTLWLGILTLSSSMGAIAFLTLAHQPPAPDCQALSALSPEIDKLYCAQQAAQSGEVNDLVAGINLVQGWTEEHPLYREGQEALTQWSKALLAIANDKFDQSDPYSAISVASHIPRNSAVYADAQQAIADWQAEWQNGETIYKAAEAAIKARNWPLANEKLLDLGRLHHDFWRQKQADYLAQRIVDEKQAWQVLDQARKLAATNKLTDIGKAITVARTISPNTFVWETAQTDQERWSQALLNVGMDHWQKGNISTAVDLIRQIPISTKAFPEATDLILYSHAQYWARSAQNQSWMPSLQEMWNLNAAIAAARQIDPQSPLYADAQGQAKAWQQQLQDLLDLKVADWFADAGQRSTYQLAIEQASQIGSDRPRRVQAQTLMAHWKLEIERLEDRPILDRAYRMAGQRTIPMLQAAIAEASQVQQGRALRLEAQTSIAHWKLEIERIEDQPLLDDAIALANQGRLSEAIEAAKRIQPKRALYDEAQSLANTWQTTIDNAAIAEDRKILDRAYGYAMREWYSVAIDIASQIAPGRPLYGEAQAAIANWKDARAAFRRARGLAPQESDSSSSYEGYYSPQ